MLDCLPTRVIGQAFQHERQIARLKIEQTRIACAQRLDIEFLYRLIWLASQHIVGLEQAEDRNVHVFDARKQQARNQCHLDRYGLTIDAVEAAHRVKQIGLGDAKQVGIIRAGVAVGARQDAHRRRRARCQNRLAEAALAFVLVKPLVSHKGAFALHATNLATFDQLVHGASDCQACRANLLGQLIFGRNHRARRVVAALDSLRNAAANLFVNRQVFYCISHSTPTFVATPSASPLSAKRYLVGRITDLQYSTKPSVSSRSCEAL